MLKIRQQILQIAPVDVPVFHQRRKRSGQGSGRADDSSALEAPAAGLRQSELRGACRASCLESELFGYEQGAFTGAVRAKPGKFEMANKGTIFLDEIAEMSPHLAGEASARLAGWAVFAAWARRSVVNVDVRVLAATNMDVKEAMRSGRFREDLYYRLNVLRFTFRRCANGRRRFRCCSGIFLVKYSEKYQKAAPDPSKHLAGSGVALSVAGKSARTREFREALRDPRGRRRKLPRTVGDDGPAAALAPREEAPAPKEQGLKALVRGLKDEAEMEAIADALEKTNWCRKDAARMLGISYKALLYKMRQFNLDSGRGSRSAAAKAAAGCKELRHQEKRRRKRQCRAPETPLRSRFVAIVDSNEANRHRTRGRCS